MKLEFDYAPVVVAAADDGQPLMFYRPEVLVTIHGPAGKTAVSAIADTGADYTVLPDQIASYCGIATLPALGPALRGFGGNMPQVSYADVEVELENASDCVRWQSRVFFNLSTSTADTIVVGHLGFLEFFTATFDGEKRLLTLEPNQYIPLIP